MLVTIFLFLTSTLASASEDLNDTVIAPQLVNFYPPVVTVKEGHSIQVNWSTHLPGVVEVEVTSLKQDIATVTAGVTSISEGDTSAEGSFEVTGVFTGYGVINITLLDQYGEVLGHQKKSVGVIISYHLVTQVFMVILGILLFFMFICMGAVFDAGVFRAIAKNPVGPVAGLVSQFLAMPLIAFGLSKAIFSDNPPLQLGLFLSGIVPGGGTSNMWTYLLGGNFDLSLIMTAVSSLVAFAAIPIWVIILGPYMSTNNEIVVPVVDIVVVTMSLWVPCCIGFFIQRLRPNFVHFFEKALTPLILFIFAFTLTFGVYANRYIFFLLTLKVIIAGQSLPFLGYCFGCLASFLFKCPKRDIIAVSVETGIQNVTLAVFMLNYTLPPPANTLAIAVPGSATVLTHIPLIVLGLGLQAHAGNITKKNILYLLGKIRRCEWDFLQPQRHGEASSKGI